MLSVKSTYCSKENIINYTICINRPIVVNYMKLFDPIVEIATDLNGKRRIIRVEKLVSLKRGNRNSVIAFLFFTNPSIVLNQSLINVHQHRKRNKNRRIGCGAREQSSP